MRAEGIERLQEVLEFTERFSLSFERLYRKLQEEIQIERARKDVYNQNQYLNDLRQTEKLAGNYLTANKRDKPLAHRRFFEGFKQDAHEELGRIWYDTNTSSSVIVW